MKLLYFIILLAAFSCTKNNNGKYCYTCNISATPAAPARTMDTCANVPASGFSFKDHLNNDRSFFCQPK